MPTKFKVKYLRTGHHVSCWLFASERYEGGFELLGQFICSPQEFTDLQREMRNVPFEDREVVDT